MSDTSGNQFWGPLAQALAPPKVAPSYQQSGQPGVPLASMVDRLAPDAIGLQQSHPSLPWYAVPGMFRQPPAAPPQAAPMAPPVDPAMAQQQAQQQAQMQAQQKLMEQQQYASTASGPQ